MDRIKIPHIFDGESEWNVHIHTNIDVASVGHRDHIREARRIHDEVRHRVSPAAAGVQLTVQ